jgi:3-phenylpropionate/trans-cinnamate dioxygenase ferredoxin subunit
VALTKVARVDEIPPGQTKFFQLPAGPVLLANYDGNVYAVSGICSHQLKPLEGAALLGPLIDCPWHHFQFDCRTGENHFPANVYPKDLDHLSKQLMPLKRYAVEVRDGEVWVDLQ